MRLLLVVFTIAALLVGCSDQPETRDEVVEAVWGAVASGDDATWRSLHHEDATVAFPGGEMIELFGPSTWVQDDYDQDGVLSFADEMQARSALHHGAQQTMRWDCAAVDDTTTECTVEATDGFIERGGGEPMVTVTRLTVIDGLVVAQAMLPPPNPQAFDATSTIHQDQMALYESWVQQFRAEEYAAAFHGPCCNSPMVLTRAGVAEHDGLMPEYFGN